MSCNFYCNMVFISLTFHRQRKAKNRTRAQRKNLPNKPTNFQIRVHVHESRNLAGSGISPAIKVLCGGEVKQTSTQKSTNDPDFNEVFFFNFCCLPKEMFDKLLDIKVVNSKTFLRDTLVGSFKLDLGLVYDEPGHAFIRKWLLLTDPEDAAGGVKVRVIHMLILSFYDNEGYRYYPMLEYL